LSFAYNLLCGVETTILAAGPRLLDLERGKSARPNITTDSIHVIHGIGGGNGNQRQLMDC
jgi:hypothetical protein